MASSSNNIELPLPLSVQEPSDHLTLSPPPSPSLSHSKEVGCFVKAVTLIYEEIPKKKIPEGEKDLNLISEAILGEEAEILEEQGEWRKILMKQAKITGWVARNTIGKEKEGAKSPYIERRKQPLSPTKIARVIHPKGAIVYVDPAMQVVSDQVAFDTAFIVIPEKHNEEKVISVALPAEENEKCGYVLKDDISSNSPRMKKEDLCEFSKQFLGIQYKWGGRTSLKGFDCSGFVQMLYKQIGKELPRNSKDQAIWEGLEELELNQLQKGDLIFFGKKDTITNEVMIKHVGMYLGESQFIHATGQTHTVCINSLSDDAWNGSGKISGYNYRTGRTLKSEKEKEKKDIE